MTTGNNPVMATNLMSDEAGDSIKTALAAGIAMAEPDSLDEQGRLFSVIVPAGSEHVIIDYEQELENAGLEDAPRRKSGTQVVHNPDAFIAYMAKHGLPRSEVWADTTRTRLTGVINADSGTVGGENVLEDVAGWGDHRVTYTLEATPAWKAWTAHDGKMLSQLEFAEHIEDRLPDMVEPSGADMLEIAQTFIANRKVKFESSKRLQSSETQLEYREEIEATAGRKGNIAIPDRLAIGIQPFEGSAVYKITARVRYRMNDGILRLGYKLDRPEDVTREAFGDIVAVIDQGIAQDVWAGAAS